MSRKSARETAFKTIFEIPFHTQDEPAEIISFTVEYAKSDISSSSDTQYFKDVVSKCYDNITTIDEKISDNLKGWSMDRISKVNLSILRLAICEIMYMEDIPYQVSINEAVELAKKYGDDDSSAFVNGVLASII